jgi:cytochrome c peroxidase
MLALVAAFAAVLVAAAPNPGPTTATLVFKSQLDTLGAALDSLATAVRADRASDAQREFRHARSAYKRAEALLAYYSPQDVIALQGPLEEGEDVSPRPYNTPGAFPMIEGAIFPQLPDSGRGAILARIHAMRERIAILQTFIATVEVDEVAIFDAARAEVARVSTLDIAGFDSDRQDDALLDAAAALDGVRDFVPPDTTVHRALRDAADYLRTHATFETMDRFAFVTRYSIPASHALATLRSARAADPMPHLRPWRQSAASVYDSGAFEPWAYSAPFARVPMDPPVLIALGARLFADPRLSGPGTRSCASCHVPTHGFTDAIPKRTSLLPPVPPPAGATPARHTPTLINSALQPAYFDDERVRTLEQQIAAVLANTDEMRSSLDTAASRVGTDSSYRAAFAAAFGAPPERAVTPTSLRVALAAYVRSLTALNSSFDRAIRGDGAAISEAARRGFTVFMGKGRCGTCHFAPLFNGVQPPTYLTSDPEIIGVPERVTLHNATIDPDPGRAVIDNVSSHRFAFKVPTVRNAAVSAPYMHNGVFVTLDDVVDFYDAGGGVGIGIDLPYQTLFDQPLHLTTTEKTDLIAFLRALTDTSGTVPSAVTVTGSRRWRATVRSGL